MFHISLILSLYVDLISIDLLAFFSYIIKFSIRKKLLLFTKLLIKNLRLSCSSVD